MTDSGWDLGKRYKVGMGVKLSWVACPACQYLGMFLVAKCSEVVALNGISGSSRSAPSCHMFRCFCCGAPPTTRTSLQSTYSVLLSPGIPVGTLVGFTLAAPGNHRPYSKSTLGH